VPVARGRARPWACNGGPARPCCSASATPANRDYVYLVTDEADVRQLALALPGTSEGTSYGTCSWRVGDRVFLRGHEEHGVLVAWCEDEHAKESLLANEPDKFFTTQHYTGHASVLVRLAVVDRPRLADLVLDAWRARASGRCENWKKGSCLRRPTVSGGSATYNATS